MAAGMLSIWCLCLWAGIFTDNTLAVDNCYHVGYIYDADINMCYDYDSSNKEYTESITLCAADKAGLVAIHTAAADTAIDSIIYGDTWIGLRFRIDYGALLWDDDSRLNYTNWKNGKGDPKCAVIKNSNGKWKTENDCGSNKKVLCLKKDSTAASCDFDNFDAASNVCYQYTGANNDWDGANTDCGGFLAVITSQAENLIVEGIIDADTWIGIKIEMTSTPFTWVDGTDVTHSNWDTNEPIEKACVLKKNSDGKWERKRCTDDKDTLCVREPACGVGYTYDVSENRCYKYFSTASTWAVAQAQCVADGSHLPYIADSNENNFNSVINSAHSVTRVWLGLQSATSTPAWADGAAATYVNWWSGELTNYRCAVMRWDTGTWITHNCLQQYNVFICYKPKGSGSCSPSYWDEHPTNSGWCILISNSWERGPYAHNLCRTWTSNTGGLLKIQSQAEHDAIFTYIQAERPYYNIMIGVYYDPIAALSKYYDGSTATYVNWNSEEPAAQSCANFRASNGYWATVTCDYRHTFTCVSTPTIGLGKVGSHTVTKRDNVSNANNSNGVEFCWSS